MTKTRALAAMAAAVLILTAAPAFADIELEPGATFDGGVCWEADGTVGITTFDGQCMTPADYDVIFGYDNLSTIPMCPPTNFDCTLDEAPSVAEWYEVDPPEVDPTPASQRVLGEGVAEPFTFVSYVEEVWVKVNGGYLIK